jgi:exodeoxyribonuclease VII large subunit
VSQYLDSLNRNLKSQKARILGEVTGVKMYEGRSYLYYSVKDKADQSTLNCFMWKRDYISSNIELVDGLEVIVTAYPSIYKPNGTISLQVEAVELVGEGALQIAYEKLKAKLSAEGLFDQNRKRLVPEYPHKIGVITSKSGAVINDFLSNVGKCGFEIMFVDSKVEGAEAIKDLLGAMKTLEKQNIDVLVMMRGGGSLESFQAFNNEVLVRAVANFPVPVVTGIGHDKDAPLVSMVSDKNVSTPTAVANLLSVGFRDGLSKVRIAEQNILASFESIYRDKMFFLEQSERIMEKSFRIIFERFEFYFNAMVRARDKVWSQISKLKSDIENSSKNIGNLGFGLIKDVQNKLDSIEKVLSARSPEQQLRLGWSISKTLSGKLIRSVNDLKEGEEFQVSVSDGTINAVNK